MEQNKLHTQEILTELKWMALIGSPYPYYTIRDIIKKTSYMNKYSAVYDIRYSLHMPMVVVNIYLFYMIPLCMLHYALPKFFCTGNFVMYIFCSGVIIPLQLNQIYVCIDMFVHRITVSALMFFVFYTIHCWFNFILVIFSYISPMYELFNHCVIVTYIFLLICLLILYPCLVRFACLFNKIYSLIVHQIKNLVVYISCMIYIFPLSPYSLT